MNPEFGYGLVFFTGLFGAFHCLGMCSGIAAGFFVGQGWRHGWLPHLTYHGTRIAIYIALGVAGAILGRVLVQAGIVGKGQGLLMMVAGVVIMLFGVAILGGLPSGPGKGCRRETALAPGAEQPMRPLAAVQRSPVIAPAAAGMVNGLVPCSLVFSMAVKTVALPPGEAAFLMLAFGIGTLPTMGVVTVAGALAGSRMRGVFNRLAGAAVVLLGIWTLYEGVVFYDVMRGLASF